MESTTLQRTHAYGKLELSGNSSAHLGDNIVHDHFHGCPPQDVYPTLLESLTFDRMDARVRNVATALPTTCEWIRSSEEFRIWSERCDVDENHGILWIKGKPGSGKSTIMKETLSWATHTWTGETTLSYFFNARATELLEKSCIGLYRSLLNQLLSANQIIQPLFVSEFASKVRNGKVLSWTEIELQNFLIKLVSEGHLTCLNVFIDALDEGNEADVRSMVNFFEEISIYAISAGVTFRLCLSSRHYPHISLEGALSITLEHQSEHNKAIQLYVDRRLRGRESELKDSLNRLLLQKAAGVFLWVVLVVPMLNQIHDRGRGMASMIEKLAKIPQTLHDLFMSLLSKDPDTSEECGALLRLLLYFMRPLSPVELYTLVQFRCGADTIDDDMQWPLHQDMAKFLADQGEFVMRWITDCSRGLVEVVDLYTRVQFIHETVRTSLTTINLSSSHHSPAHVSMSSSFNFESSISHHFIAEGCIEYLLHARDDLLVDRRRETLEILHRASPSIVYAADHWWRHAKSAQMTPQLLKLVMSLLRNRVGLAAWATYYNMTSEERFKLGFGAFVSPLRSYAPREVRRRGHYVGPSVGVFGEKIYPSSEEPMYYAALIGIPEVVDAMLLDGQSPNASGKYYKSALQAASAHGHKEIVERLLTAGANVDQRGGAYGKALTAAICKGEIEIMQMLFEAGAKLEAIGCENAFDIAATNHDVKVFVFLLDICQRMSPSLPTIAVVLYGICQMSYLVGFEKSAELFDQTIRRIFPGVDMTLTVEMFDSGWLKEKIWPGTRSESIRRLADNRSILVSCEDMDGLQYLVVPEALEQYIPISDRGSKLFIERNNLVEDRNELLYRLAQPAFFRGQPLPHAPPPSPEPGAITLEAAR